MRLSKIAGLALGGLAGALGYAIVAPPRVPVAGVPAGFDEKQAGVGDVTLNYVEGPDSGPPLLLIPGQMEAWQGYKRVLPRLAELFHVYAVDPRGHGKSGRTPGRYSYTLCGGDLKLFLEQVVQRPAVVAGLSSGAVLAVWLGAYAPDSVRAVISEDPPLYSSIWPRITQEKYMARLFQVAVETLGGPGERDLRAYFAQMGIPNPKGGDDLLLMPAPIARAIVAVDEINRKLRPGRADDPPFLPFTIRAGLKFLREYDVDFSAATLDGRLSQGFDPDDALRRVQSPLLLLHASWSRHPTWGLLGAADADDVARMRALAPHLRYAHIDAGHDIHMSNPAWYLEQVLRFTAELGIGEGTVRPVAEH